MLLAIKKYFQEKHCAALSDLTTHFGVTVELMESMLAEWINKGKLEKIDLSKACCKGCAKGCLGKGSTFYRWLETERTYDKSRDF